MLGPSGSTTRGDVGSDLTPSCERCGREVRKEPCEHRRARGLGWGVCGECGCSSVEWVCVGCGRGERKCQCKPVEERGRAGGDEPEPSKASASDLTPSGGVPGQPVGVCAKCGRAVRYGDEDGLTECVGCGELEHLCDCAPVVAGGAPEDREAEPSDREIEFACATCGRPARTEWVGLDRGGIEGVCLGCEKRPKDCTCPPLVSGGAPEGAEPQEILSMTIQCAKGQHDACTGQCHSGDHHWPCECPCHRIARNAGHGPLKMSRSQWRALHADYRSTINGKPYALTLDEATGATILAPVHFEDEPVPPAQPSKHEPPGPDRHWFPLDAADRMRDEGFLRITRLEVFADPAANCWVARMDGSWRDRAFTGDLVPTPFTLEADPEMVLADLRRRNPEAEVVLAKAVQLPAPDEAEWNALLARNPQQIRQAAARYLLATRDLVADRDALDAVKFLIETGKES